MHTLQRTQLIKASIEDIWDFFSNPENLRKLTPEYMDFQIKNGPLEPMYAGQLIEYRIRPLLGVPVKWVTEITHCRKHSFFVDEQRFGPYAFWHHRHFFTPESQGILMTDIVTYKLPFGPLGGLAHVIFIKKQLTDIFNFRRVAVELEFAHDKTN